MGSSSERTHPSSFSTAFEGSAFGSGSSVLSSFEPPSDSELFEKTTLAQLLDDTYNFPGTLVCSTDMYDLTLFSGRTQGSHL